MSLGLAAILVSTVIALCCGLPWIFPGIRAYSRPLMLVGTVVLLGFLAFDLIPEMVELGGTWSFLLVLASSGLFTLLHAFVDKGHNHAHSEETPEHGVLFLLGSMALHCFAGGMLLVSSYEVSERMAFAVFLSLIGHKAFEAVSVSSVLFQRVISPRRLLRYSALYVLSFPLGVAVTEWARRLYAQALTPEQLKQAGLILTSIAVGSLFGCLIQDFLIPAMRDLRRPACDKEHSHGH
jgi:zinc transporter ZupT